LSLLFLAINDHERLKLPWSIRPPSQSSNFASCLSRWWGEGGLEFLGNASRCNKGWPFEEMSNKSALSPGRCLVALWWTFTWDSSGQMEWDLDSSPIGYPSHPGILETQTFPNGGKTEMRSCFPWRVIWLQCCHWGIHEESLMNLKQEIK
jgi:hypothetical protein